MAPPAPTRARPPCAILWFVGPQAFKILSRGNLTWLECAALARLPRALHAFGTRQEGSGAVAGEGPNLGLTEADQRANIDENWRAFLRQLGAERFDLATLRQTHSAEIYQVAHGSFRKLDYRPTCHPSPRQSEDRLREGDALVTDQLGILLSVRSADCLPILLVDSRCRAIAAIHAGWRGALERIVEKTVGELRRLFNTQPRDFVAAVGPSIRACCYEVGQEVVAAFCGRFPNGKKFFRKAPPDPTAARSHSLITRSAGYHLGGRGDDPRSSEGRHGSLPLPKHHLVRRGDDPCDPATVPAAHLDLVAVARDQLLRAGMRPSNICVAEFCTACRTDLFYSYRREGSRAGRMISIVGIRPS